ncbi:MAG: UDP-N-acetylmuramoyl-L-alanyl-D-glutamate--2,6-diaminopimelate ligase [Phycisphaerae bacterium]
MQYSEIIDYIDSTPSVNVTEDSRTLSRGDIFVALQGTKQNGLDYVAQALKKGARFIVCGKPMENLSGPVVVVDDERHALAELSHYCAGNPSEKLFCLAVTGTNGKTTVSTLVSQVLNGSDIKTALIGTVENNLCGAEGATPAVMTTPSASVLAKMLAEIVENGGKAVSLEASSHALNQQRLDCIKFKAAAFTNLTGDHLDYHGDMESYFQSKKRLFHNLPDTSNAVINLDCPYGARLYEEFAGAIGFSMQAHPAGRRIITAREITTTARGSRYRLDFEGERFVVESPMAGIFNISNQLAAAGLCLVAGLSLEQIAAQLTKATAPRGRLQSVPNDRGFSVFIDYAHTDDALENVLRAIRALTKGKVITVFGCGGDRDKTKRARMAAVSEKLSDISIVTSDNPRMENPDAIIADILKGFSRKAAPLTEPDRAAAIKLAVSKAREGDVVLIAGKGHEDYQIIGTQKHHFSDFETAAELLV